MSLKLKLCLMRELILDMNFVFCTKQGLRNDED